MDQDQYDEFSQITLQQFLAKTNQIQCKVVGTISSVFKHKRYIIQILINKKTVIRCYKRYNEFQALYQLIQMKYKNYKMKQLPSKFQLFNKQQSRKTFFQNMLNQIIKDHSMQDQHSENMHETSRRLLSIIYLFLTSNVEEQKLKKQKKQEKFLKKISKDDQGPEGQKNNQETMVQSKSMILPFQPTKQNVQQKFAQQKSEKKKHKMSLDMGVQPEDHRPRSNSVQNQFISVVKESRTTQINQFEVKFQHEDAWKKRYIQVVDSSLLLFTNKLDNYFKTNIELFRVKVQFMKRRMNVVDHFAEKFQFDLTRTFNQNPTILSIYHRLDCDKILIRKPVRAGQDPEYSLQVLRKLKETIFQASQKSPIFPNFDGVFNPIGKIFIFLHKLKLSWKKHTDQQTIHIRIKTGALVYQSRPIVYSNQISINQGFLIPISNTFQIIRVQCYSIKDEGWVQDEKQTGKIMGVFSFNMMEFVTKPQRYLINKTVVKLQTAQSKAEKYSTRLQVSIENYSDYSSIYSESFSNQHDGIPLKQIQGVDDIDDLAMTVDRVLHIMGNIALLIQAFWRNVYLFKYPRMGYLFFAIILFNAVFLEVNDIVREFIGFILLCVLYQEKHLNLAFKYLMDRFLFCRIHKNFKNPLILSTGQVSYLKWSNQLNYIKQDYYMKDGKLIKKSDKKRTTFQFEVHGRKFTVMQDEQSFFEKVKQAKKIIELIHKTINTIVSSLQKVANLLSWTDYKRSLFLGTLLLILTGIASGSLVRLLISLFCIHRFYKGLFFYNQKHYYRNRLFAVYGLRYILQKSFPQITGDPNVHKNMSLKQLDEYLSELVFPIHDEVAQKKLKLQMDEIMGVYLQPQSLYPKTIKKNYLKVVNLLDMVQSCQSRLKLKWISGAQGISNQFQQLKQETRQYPQIDIWLENAVINFIMNTPSLLFMAFHKPRFAKAPTPDKKPENLQQNDPLNSTTNMNNSMLSNWQVVDEDPEPLQIKRTTSQMAEEGTIRNKKQDGQGQQRSFLKKRQRISLQQVMLFKQIVKKI